MSWDLLWDSSGSVCSVPTLFDGWGNRLQEGKELVPGHTDSECQVLGQRGEPGGPVLQLLINDKVLWVKSVSFERLGIPGLEHEFFKRGFDASLLIVFTSPWTWVQHPKVLGFCTKTSKNKRRVIWVFLSGQRSPCFSSAGPWPELLSGNCSRKKNLISPLSSSPLPIFRPWQKFLKF